MNNNKLEYEAAMLRTDSLEAVVDANQISAETAISLLDQLKANRTELMEKADKTEVDAVLSAMRVIAEELAANYSGADVNHDVLLDALNEGQWRVIEEPQEGRHQTRGTSHVSSPQRWMSWSHLSAARVRDWKMPRRCWPMHTPAWPRPMLTASSCAPNCRS